MSQWKDAWKKRVQEWTYAPLAANQVPDNLQHIPIPAKQAYISAFLRSMRVVHVRLGLKKFYGTVHSFISIPHFSGRKAEFHVLTTPTKLQNVDASNIDYVIDMNHRLLGPVPYYGGDIEMEVGLFSVKSAELAGPFLSMLEGLSNAAGVSFFNLARPYIKPLQQGINLLFGTQSDTILEIGLARTFDKPETGYFLVMRAPKGQVDTTTLKVQQDYRLVYAQGEPIARFPYMLLCIEASDQRENWFEIPELIEAHKDLQEAIKKGSGNDLKEAQARFHRIARTCPDLIPKDAQKIVEEVDNNVREFAAQLTASGNITIPDLRDVKIYD